MAWDDIQTNLDSVTPAEWNSMVIIINNLGIHNELSNLTWSTAGHTIDTNLDMNSNKITELLTPTSDYDASTKKYVDDNSVTDHGGLSGLSDDDHSQYYNLTRHTKTIHDSLSIDYNSLSNKPTIINDHGGLSGLSDDDHSQYYNSTRHTKAIHDSLGINADTLDGNHATAFLGVSAKAANSELLDGLDSLAFIKKDGSVAMTGTFNMNSNYIQSIKYADAYTNTLPGLFTQYDRDANGMDFYSTFHSYIPSAVAAASSTHRVFGLSSEVHTEGLAHSTTDFTHCVALFGSVVSGKLPGNGSCQIWGLNTLIESQYDSGTGKGFEQYMQGYENDINRSLPHVMKEDSGVLYTNYYSSGDKGTVLNNATDVFVALNHCLGFNATGINYGNPGAAYSVGGGGTAYWNVGVLLDHPFQYAAVVIGDGQKIMWKNNSTNQYETRLMNSAHDFHISAGSSGSIVCNNPINMSANKIVSLAEPTSNSDAATKYYVDNVGGGGTTVHSLLSNLTWSTAGHTMDTILDMNSNRIRELAAPAISTDAATKGYADTNISTHAALSASVHGVSASGFEDKANKNTANGYAEIDSDGFLKVPGSTLIMIPDTGNMVLRNGTVDKGAFLVVNNAGISTRYYDAYVNRGTTADSWDRLQTLLDVTATMDAHIAAYHS